MLEDCLIESRSSARSRKPATLILSILVHGTLAVALIVIPLFQIPLLPQVPVVSALTPPPIAARGAVEVVPVKLGGPSQSTSSSSSFPATKPLTAPEAMPTMIAPEDSAPVVLIGNALLPGDRGGPGGGSRFGDPNGSDDGVGGPGPFRPPSPPPAPPPPPPPPPVTAPVRVGTIEPSKLIYSVQPVYPRLAAMARVEGSVLLEAVITRDGLVDPKRLKVVEGHNLLWPAAVEAVQQWRYKPTVLSGQRVEIIANITVNFSLNR